MKTQNTSKRMIATTSVVAVGILMAASQAFAAQFDLVNFNNQTVTGFGGNDAVFVKSSVATSGTGAIDPFLRVHDRGFEQGFNTSAPGNPPDGFDAKNGVWTHDLLLSSLKITTYEGVGSYYQFMLDLGEPGNKSANLATSELLLLQKFNLYTGNNAAPTFASIAGNPDNLGTKRFDLAGNSIMLYDENHGNGQADVFIYVPTAAFAGVTDPYLYLYTEMGLADGNGQAESTFEEFSALTGPNTTKVPDGGTTLALLGLALAGLGGFARSRRVS